MLQRAGIAEVEVLAAIMARCFRSNYTGLISEAAFEADLAIAALTERVRSYLQRKVSETWAIRDGEGFVSFGASRDADATPQVGEVYALLLSQGSKVVVKAGSFCCTRRGVLPRSAIARRRCGCWTGSCLPVASTKVQVGCRTVVARACPSGGDRSLLSATDVTWVMHLSTL